MIAVKIAEGRYMCNECKRTKETDAINLYEVQIGGVVGCLCGGCLTCLKSSLDFQFKTDEQLNGGYDGFKR